MSAGHRSRPLRRFPLCSLRFLRLSPTVQHGSHQAQPAPGTEGLLRNFIAFLQAERVAYITRQVALRWATQPAKAQPATWAGRLGIIRRFAIWHSATEPRTEIPPAGVVKPICTCLKVNCLVVQSYN